MKKQKECREEGCHIQATIGHIGGVGETCNKHRDPGCVNVNVKRCTTNYCGKIATFGVKGTKIRVKCGQHRMKGFVNVNNGKYCKRKNCIRIPTYGKNGTLLTCKFHKKDGYIYMKKSQPNTVVNMFKKSKREIVPGRRKQNPKRCVVEDCENIARFGVFHKGVGRCRHISRCNDHRLEGDVNLTIRPCVHGNCMRQPLYGAITDLRASVCSDHNRHGYINLRTPRCKSDACSVYAFKDRSIANKPDPDAGRNNRLCTFCWRSMFPELSRHVSIRKEQFVLAEVQSRIPDLERYFMASDCKIPGQSCSTKRPDMVWKIGETLLQLEVDENGIKHEDDTDRLIDIHAAADTKYHICVRFNPDRSSDGSPPCMIRTQTKVGEPMYVRDAPEWNRRMGLLESEMRKILVGILAGESENMPWKVKVCF